MFNLELSEIENDEKEIIELQYCVSSYKIPINFKKNTQNKLCFYVDKSINTILNTLILNKKPEFAFIGNFIFSMIEPLEIIYDLNQFKFLEIFYNNNSFDSSFLTDENYFKNNNLDIKTSNLKDYFIKLDPFTSDNLSNFGMDDYNQLENFNVSKMLSGGGMFNLMNNKSSLNDEISETEDESEEEVSEDDSEDELSEEISKDEEFEEENKEIEIIENSKKPNNENIDISSLLKNMPLDMSMLTGMMGNMNLSNKKETPENLLNNIKNIWTNEYNDVKEQEELDDFLIKDDDEEIIEDKIITTEVSTPKTRYLSQDLANIAIEALLQLDNENIIEYENFINRITTREQFNDLVNEIKNKTVDNLEIEKVKIFQEVRNKENGEEYIYRKIYFLSKESEISIDYELVVRIRNAILKILNFAK
jgi:hypothetical protein